MTENDDQLIQAFRQGDERAWERVPGNGRRVRGIAGDERLNGPTSNQMEPWGRIAWISDGLNTLDAHCRELPLSLKFDPQKPKRSSKICCCRCWAKRTRSLRHANCA